MKKVLFVLITLIFLTGCSRSKERKAQPFEKFLPDPEKVLRQKDQISLTDDQAMVIENYYHEKEILYDSLREGLRIKTEALTKVVEKHPVDLGVAQSSLLELLKAEEKIKLLQLDVYVFTKNHMTPEQLGSFKEH